MNLISKRSVVPLILLLVFAVLDSGQHSDSVIGIVIACAAIYIGAVISDAARQIVVDLRETQQQVRSRDQEDSKDVVEPWK